ncbi:GNAT family N-acetyltransferase [Streptomyces clavuligerus]|uniref:Putative aminoglycoside 2-N-acetyltransferase n=1 Tax=Streptomyces clavuligerus TaxID=1901 RepID=E2Q7Z9_STRCL|nr:GNAT family N-acetyltransferase [Streptomyces clavuligerus]ANW17913.1 aminoglycoside 2'-N-acetyltransferase [Streptomyces clavuligerus]AXU12469.1 GNAT family N-acetyltransferase [Streptomyces clavuligerus]EFG09531.1 putative aminoglycoside 2-N-acetyltransferase [Streptomyces clavuligerus]MBY6302361.1 GNAT family N-acetyltransferase [Streptomyces clavuligerus]QCS05251.1 GNAT family N-acetyltransferase [Streptomyces clavuligerus]
MTDALRTLHTSSLTPAELTDIRALLDGCFRGDLDDDDFDHLLGGMHTLVRDAEGRMVAHGSVIMRRVRHGDRFHRVGYVEAMAVREDRRREGLGSRVMDELEGIIDRAYDFGALSASALGELLYRSRGWWAWPGRIEGIGPQGLVHLPDEEGTVLVRGAVPGDRGALAFDWRDGDVL